MSTANLGKRFLESTRGQIIALLRRGANTVEDLAQGLGLTDNAIRAHLATLERDGLIRQNGVRRGGGAGKPATLYEIHPETELLFSRAYAPVLEALVQELADQLPAERREALMKGLGRRLAAEVGPAPKGALSKRVEAAAGLLDSWGGATRVEKKAGTLQIRGVGGCPLSAATALRPELCSAVRELLAEFIGAEVAECCDRGERPRCHFEIGASTAAR